jgi:hypothetical protein
MPKPHTPPGGFPGAWKSRQARKGGSWRESFKMGMTQKRQCHARESGHPDLAARAGALDSRVRGNDTTLEDLILNDAPVVRLESYRAKG